MMLTTRRGGKAVNVAVSRASVTDTIIIIIIVGVGSLLSSTSPFPNNAVVLAFPFLWLRRGRGRGPSSPSPAITWSSTTRRRKQQQELMRASNPVAESARLSWKGLTLLEWAYHNHCYEQQHHHDPSSTNDDDDDDDGVHKTAADTIITLNDGKFTDVDVAVACRSFWQKGSMCRRVFAIVVTSSCCQLAQPALAVMGENDKDNIESNNSNNENNNNNNNKATSSFSLLRKRLETNDLMPPLYGMDGLPDVIYPSWLSGTWKVVSETTDVQAPCGVAFFGGNQTYLSARAQLGPDHALVYEARFLPAVMPNNNNNNNNNNNKNVEKASSLSSSTCIADREFNVKSIAKVALGPNSIVDVALATPNHFACLVLPPSQPTTTATTTTSPSPPSRLLNVDILVLQRRQEQIIVPRPPGTDYPNQLFVCSEVVREIVTPVTAAADSTTTATSASPTRPSSSQQQQQQGAAAAGGGGTSMIFKEVETISIYYYYPSGVGEDGNQGGDGRISSTDVHCQQRSASYLVPRRDDPRSIAMWQATQGLPVDVRWYNVTYSRKR